MALPPNSHPYLRPIPGDKARRVVDVRTGEILSRRAYQKALHGVSPEKAAARNRVENAGKPIPAWKLRYDEARMAFARKHGITTGQARMDKRFQLLYRQMENQRLRIIKALHPGYNVRVPTAPGKTKVLKGSKSHRPPPPAELAGPAPDETLSDRNVAEGTTVSLGSQESRNIASDALSEMTELQKDLLFGRYHDLLIAIGLDIMPDWLYSFL